MRKILLFSSLEFGIGFSPSRGLRPLEPFAQAFPKLEMEVQPSRCNEFASIMVCMHTPVFPDDHTSFV